MEESERWEWEENGLWERVMWRRGRMKPERINDGERIKQKDRK